MSAPLLEDRAAVTPTELAQIAGCTRQHVQNKIADGTIPSVKLGRKRLISAQWVAEFLTGDAYSPGRLLSHLETVAIDLTPTDIGRLRALLTEAEAGQVVA